MKFLTYLKIVKSLLLTPIVNPYTVFDKPQVSFKKSMKKLLGPSQSSTVKEYVQTSKFDQYNILASEDRKSVV